MTMTATPNPVQPLRLGQLFKPTPTELDVAAAPSDGLVVFGVMWGMATILSIASHVYLLVGSAGALLAVLNWAIFGVAGFLVMHPRRTKLLGLLGVLMILQYGLRLPVSSNNQTIALFMNLAIVAVLASEIIKNRNFENNRTMAYERLRIVARSLLAIMYFYGVFHKINTDFLHPEASCATALYTPLMSPFGLGTNLIGIYSAIASTFIIETIALICLYWRKYFWVGLILSLPFHFVIPISGYSWYMDFSSLVFALYMLSVPREVAAGLYSTGVSIVRRFAGLRGGTSAILALAAVGLLGAVVVVLLTTYFPGRPLRLMWHSVWLLVWTAFGGTAMVLITRAALLALPYSEPPAAPRQPLWIYAFPAALFLTCLSPYVGLKTESSISMFSNLHTEGGASNHLLLPKPPYAFDYQARVARIVDASYPAMRRFAGTQTGFVEHDIAIRLRGHPERWISYTIDGKRYDRVTEASFTGHWPTLIERKLLDFKPVDFARPKVCTH